MDFIDGGNLRDAAVAGVVIIGFWLIVGGIRLQHRNTAQSWSNSCLSHRQRSTSAQLCGPLTPDLPTGLTRGVAGG
jgi:hypothetical protein